MENIYQLLSEMERINDERVIHFVRINSFLLASPQPAYAKISVGLTRKFKKACFSFHYSNSVKGKFA